MERNLTTGSVFKNILRFSLPYLFSYFLQTLYGMADLYLIGQFGGVDQTTAVSVGSQVMHMVTVMLVGLAMGTTVMVGQSVGGNRSREAARYIGNTVTLFFAGSVALSGILLLGRSLIVSVMAVPAEAVSGTKAYLTICFLGIPFITAYNIISSIFRGLGDSKSPLYFIAAACVVNVGLDYLFMGAFGMGPAGAALGTTLSQTVSVLVALTVISRRKTGLQLQKADFRPGKQTMGKLLKIGVPVALQDGFIQISFLLITIIANHRGLEDAAAVGIVEKVIGMLFLVPSSMLSTVSALAAQNIGAGRRDRAVKTLRYAVLLCVVFGSAASLAVQFCAEPVLALFSEDARVILLGSQYFRGYVFDCIFAGIHFCFSGYFCAGGKSGLSFLHNVLSIVLARIPGAYLASRIFADTLYPMGLAVAGGSLLSVAVCVIAFVWLQKKEKQDG